MIQVPAMRNPGLAVRQLGGVYGFGKVVPGRLSLGDQEIVVRDTIAVPEILADLPRRPSGLE